MPVSQKIKYQMQGISVNLTNDCDENQLNYSNDLPVIKKKELCIIGTFPNIFFDSNR